MRTYPKVPPSQSPPCVIPSAGTCVWFPATRKGMALYVRLHLSDWRERSKLAWRERARDGEFQGLVALSVVGPWLQPTSNGAPVPRTQGTASCQQPQRLGEELSSGPGRSLASACPEAPAQGARTPGPWNPGHDNRALI